MLLAMSAFIACGLTGMMLPWILMLMGEPAEMKMSEAFFYAISCRSFSMNMVVRPLVSRSLAAEQLVYSRFGTGFRVDLLDYHRAVETIPAIPPGQVAGNYDASRRNLPVGDLSGGPVVDLGALADVDPHRDHRAFAHDDPFDDLAAGADEAVVLDDGGVGLQGLQDAADADPAGQVHVLADLRARAHRGPRVDHGAFVHVGADVHVGGHHHHA